MAKPYIPYDGPIIKRKQARANGLKRYFTGLPCQKGHFSQRWVSTYSCVTCAAEAGLVYRKANPEKIRARERIYKARNPEKIKAKKARGHLRNRDKVLAAQKLWREQNRDLAIAISKRWKELNPDQHLVNGRNYRARARAAAGSHTLQDIRVIISRQGNRCAYCKRKLGKFHVDHIVPLSKGGSNAPSNLQCLCVQCNLKKGVKLAEQFVRELGLLL